MRLLTILVFFLVGVGCDGAAIVSRPAVDGGADASAFDDVEKVLPLDAPRADPAARGWVSGRAWDARTGEPLENVELVVGDAVMGRTDATGAYSLVLPQGGAVLTARATGRVPFVRNVVVTEAPLVLDLPLTVLGPSEMVTPAGATLTTPQGVTVRFPADAVRSPTRVTATWLDGDGVAALDAPGLVHDGDSDAVLRGALVVSDLTLAVSARVEIPVPPDVLPASLSLRPIREGEAGARLWPVSTGRGTVVFEVPHFSAWGLWVELPEVRQAPADCGGQRLGYILPSTLPWDAVLERGTQRIPLSASSSDPMPPRTAQPSVDVFCGDTLRAARRVDLLMSGNYGGLRVIGERFPFRVYGTANDLRVEALQTPQTDLKLEVTAWTVGDRTLRLFLSTSLQVVVDGGAAVRLRRIRCSSDYGWAVTHEASRSETGGRVIVSSLSSRRYALSAGAEVLRCASDASPTERLTPAPGTCSLPSDCAAPTRCDPASQRCVLPRGAACTPNGPPCDDGARCFDGRCVAQTAANADAVSCTTDADCPDERCDLARRECRSPLDTSGARPCAAERGAGSTRCSPPRTPACRAPCGVASPTGTAPRATPPRAVGLPAPGAAALHS
ncbi:MAG: hypothetical protein U0325_23495 [Polyangiales bacterium]